MINPIRWLVVILAAAATIAVNRPAGAQPLDDWALADLDAAERALSAALADADAASRDLDSARWRIHDLRQAIDRESAPAEQLRRQISQSEKTLEQISIDRAAAQRQADELRGCVDDLRRRLDVAEAKLNALRDAEIQRFEAGEPFVTARKALDEAIGQVQTAGRAAVARLALTDAYRRLVGEVEAASARAEMLRQAPGYHARELSESITWHTDATNRLRAMESAAVEADPAVRLARQDADAKAAALGELQREFAARLSEMPHVQDATSEADRARADLQGPSAELSRVEQRLAQVEQAFKTQSDWLSGAKVDLAQREARLATLQQQMDAVQAEAANLEARLAGALAAADQAREARNWAWWRLREARLVYAPPVVVLPPPMYAKPCPPAYEFRPPRAYGGGGGWDRKPSESRPPPPPAAPGGDAQQRAKREIRNAENQRQQYEQKHAPSPTRQRSAVEDTSSRQTDQAPPRPSATVQRQPQRTAQLALEQEPRRMAAEQQSRRAAAAPAAEQEARRAARVAAEEDARRRIAEADAQRRADEQRQARRAAAQQEAQVAAETARRAEAARQAETRRQQAAEAAERQEQAERRARRAAELEASAPQVSDRRARR